MKSKNPSLFSKLFKSQKTKRSLVLSGVALFIAVIIIIQSFSIALYPQSKDDGSYTFFYSEFNDKKEWKGVYRFSFGSIVVDSNFNAMSKRIQLYWYGMQQLFLEVKGIDTASLDSSSALQIIDADTSRILYELRKTALSSNFISVDLSGYIYEDTSALFVNIIGSIKISDYIKIFTPKLYYHNFLTDGKTFPTAYNNFGQLYLDYLATADEVTYKTPVVKIPYADRVNLTFAFSLVPSLTTNYSMFSHIYADVYGVKGFGEVEERVEVGYSFVNMSFGIDYLSVIDEDITALANLYVRFYVNFDCLEVNDEDIKIKLFAFFLQPHNNVEEQSDYINPSLYLRKSPHAYVSEQVVEGRVFNALTVDRQGYIGTYKVSHMDTIFYDKLDQATVTENYTIGNPDTLVYDFDSSNTLRLNSSGYLYSSESVGNDFSLSTSFYIQSYKNSHTFAGLGVYGTHSYEFAVGNMTIYEETYFDEESTVVKVREVYQAYLHVYKDDLLLRSYALNQTFSEGQTISLSLSSKFGYKTYSVQINHEEIVISLPEVLAIGGNPGIFTIIPFPSPDDYVSFFHLSASGITDYSPRRLLVYSKTQQDVTVVLKATRIDPLTFASKQVVIGEEKLAANKEGILYFAYIPKPFEYLHLEVYCTNPDEELISPFSILAMKFSGIHKYNTIIPAYDYYDISDHVYFEKRNLISEDTTDSFLASYDAIIDERYSLLEIGAEAQDTIPDTQIDVYTRKLNSGLPFTFQGTVYWTEHSSGSFFSHVLYLDLSPGNYEVRLDRPSGFSPKLNISYLLLRPLTSYANAVTDAVGFTNPASWEKDFTTDKIDSYNGVDLFEEESYYSLVHPSCYMQDDGSGNYEQFTDWTPSTDDTQIWSVEDNLASFVGGVKLDLPDVAINTEGYPYFRFVARSYLNHTIKMKLTFTYSDGTSDDQLYSVTEDPQVYFYNFELGDTSKLLSEVEFFTNYILYSSKEYSIIVSDIHLYRLTNIDVKLEDQATLETNGFDTSNYSSLSPTLAPFLSNYHGLFDISLNSIPEDERVKVWTDNDAGALEQYSFTNDNHYLLPSTLTVPLSDWRVNKGKSMSILSSPLTSLNLNFILDMNSENRQTLNESMSLELFELNFHPLADAYASSPSYSSYKLKFYLYGTEYKKNDEGEMEGGYLYYRLFGDEGSGLVELTPTYDMLSSSTDFLQAIEDNVLDFPNKLSILNSYEKGSTSLIKDETGEEVTRSIYSIDFGEAYTISLHFGQNEQIKREYADADTHDNVFSVPFFVGVASMDTFEKLYTGTTEKATLLFADEFLPSYVYPSLYIQTFEETQQEKLLWSTDYSLSWTPEPTFYINIYEPLRDEETGFKPLPEHINLFENRFLLLNGLKTPFEKMAVTPYLVNENYGDFVYLPKFYSATFSTLQDVYVTDYDLSFEGTGNFQLIGSSPLKTHTFDYNDPTSNNWKNEYSGTTISALKFISTYEKDILPPTYLSCLDYLSYDYYSKNKKREYSFTDGFTNYEDWKATDFSLFEGVKEPSLRSSPLGLVIDENSLDFTNNNMDSIYDYFDPTDELEELYSFSGEKMYYLPSYYMKGGTDNVGHQLWDRVLSGEVLQGLNPYSSPYYKDQLYLYNNWMYDLQSQVINKVYTLNNTFGFHSIYDEGISSTGLDFSSMLPDYLRFKPVYYSDILPKEFIWSFDINVDSWSLGSLAEDYVKFFDKEEGRYSFYISIPIILPSHGHFPSQSPYFSYSPNVLRLFIYYDSGSEYHDLDTGKGYVLLDPHYSIYLGRSIVGTWRASESVSLHFEITVEEKELPKDHALYEKYYPYNCPISHYYNYNIQMWINNDNMYWELLKLPMWMLSIPYPYMNIQDGILNYYQNDLMYNQLFDNTPSGGGFINPQYKQSFNNYYKGLYGDKEPIGFQPDNRLFFSVETATGSTFHWLQYQRPLVSDKYYSLSLSEYGLDPSNHNIYDWDYHYYSRDNYAGMIRSDLADVRFENPKYVRGEYNWFKISEQEYKDDQAFYNIDYALDNALYTIPHNTIGFGVNYPFAGISDVVITPLNTFQTHDLNEDGIDDYACLNGAVSTDGENLIVKPGSSVLTTLNLSDDLDIAIKFKDVIAAGATYPYDKTTLEYSYKIGLQEERNNTVSDLNYYFSVRNSYPYNQYFEYINSEQIDQINHFSGDDTLPSFDSGITQPIMGSYVGIKGYKDGQRDYTFTSEQLSSVFKNIFQPMNSLLYNYLNIKYDSSSKILTFILWSEKYGNKQSYETSYDLSDTGEVGAQDLKTYELFFETENAYLFIDKIYTRTFMPVTDTNEETYYRGSGLLGDYYLYSPINHGLELQEQVTLSYEDYSLSSFGSTDFYFIPTSETIFTLTLDGIKKDDSKESLAKVEVKGKECKLSFDGGDSWTYLNSTNVETGEEMFDVVNSYSWNSFSLQTSTSGDKITVNLNNQNYEFTVYYDSSEYYKYKLVFNHKRSRTVLDNFSFLSAYEEFEEEKELLNDKWEKDISHGFYRQVQTTKAQAQLIIYGAPIIEGDAEVKVTFNDDPSTTVSQTWQQSTLGLKMDYYTYLIPSSVDLSKPVKVSLSVSSLAVINWLSIEPMKDIESLLYLSDNNKYLNSVYSSMEYFSGSTLIDSPTNTHPYAKKVEGVTQVKFSYAYSLVDLDFAPNVIFEGFVKGKGKISFSFKVKLADKFNDIPVKFVGNVGQGLSSEEYIAEVSRNNEAITISTILSSTEKQDEWVYFYLSLYQLVRHIPKDLLVDNYSTETRQIDLLDETYPVSGIISDVGMIEESGSATVCKTVKLEKGIDQDLYVSDFKSTIANSHSAYPYEDAITTISEEIEWKRFDVPLDGSIPLDEVYVDDFDGSAYNIYDTVFYVDTSTYSKIHLTVETEGSFVLSNRYSIILQKMGFENEVTTTVFSVQKGFTPFYLHVVFPRSTTNQNIRIRYLANSGVSIGAETNKEGDAISDWLVSTAFYSEKNTDTVDYLNFISRVTPMEGERFSKRLVDSEGMTYTESIEFSQATLPGFCSLLDYLPVAIPYGNSIILTTSLDISKTLDTSLVLLLDQESGIVIESLLWDEVPLLYNNEGVFTEIVTDMEKGMITIPLNDEGLTVNSLFSPQVDNPNDYGFVEYDPDYNYHFKAYEPFSVDTSTSNPSTVKLNTEGIHRITIQLKLASPYNTDFGVYLENAGDSMRTVLSPSDKAIDFHALCHKNLLRFENELNHPQTLAQLDKNEDTVFKSRYFVDDYGQYHSYRIYNYGLDDEYTVDKGNKWKVYDGDNDPTNDIIYESTTHYNWKHIIGKMRFAIVIDEGTPQVLQLPFSFLVGYQIFCDWVDKDGDGLEDTALPYLGWGEPLDATVNYDFNIKGVFSETEEGKKVNYNIIEEQEAILRNLIVKQSSISSLSTKIYTRNGEEIPLTYSPEEITSIETEGLTFDRYLSSFIQKDYFTYSDDISVVDTTILSSTNKEISFAYNYDKDVLFTHIKDNDTGEEEKIIYDYRYDCFSVLTPDAVAHDNYRVDLYTFNNKISLYDTDLYKLDSSYASYGLFDDPSTLAPLMSIENYHYELKETVNALDVSDAIEGNWVNSQPTTIVDAFAYGLSLSQVSVEMYSAEIEMDYYSLDLFYSVFFSEYAPLKNFFYSYETIPDHEKYSYYPSGQIQFSIWISCVINSYVAQQGRKLFEDEYQNRTTRYESRKANLAALKFLLDFLLPYRGFHMYGEEPEPEETHHPRFSSYVDFKYSLVLFWGLALGNSAGCGIPKDDVPFFKNSERTGKLLLIDELWDRAIKAWNLVDTSRVDDPSPYLPFTDDAIVEKILFDAEVQGDKAMVDWITNEKYSAEAYRMKPYGTDYAIYYWLKAFTIQQGYDPYAIKVYTVEEINSQEREDFDENYFVIGVPVSTIENQYIEYNWFVSLDKETKIPTSTSSKLYEFIPLIIGQSSNPQMQILLKIIKTLGNAGIGENYGYNTLSMSEYSFIVTLEFLVNLIDLGALLLDIRDSYIGATPFIRKMALMQIPMDILDLFTPGPFSLVGNTMNSVFKSIVGDVSIDTVKGLTKTMNLIDVINNPVLGGTWKTIARVGGKSELMIWIVDAARATYKFSKLANSFYQWFFFLPQKIFMSSLQLSIGSIMKLTDKMILAMRSMDVEEAMMLNIKAQQYYSRVEEGKKKFARMMSNVQDEVNLNPLVLYGENIQVIKAETVVKYYMNIILSKASELEQMSKAILDSIQRSRLYVLMSLRYGTHMALNTPDGLGIHFSPNIRDNEIKPDSIPRDFEGIIRDLTAKETFESPFITWKEYLEASADKLKDYTVDKFDLTDVQGAKYLLYRSFSSIEIIHSTPENFYAYKELMDYIEKRFRDIKDEKGDNLEFTPIWWILHVPIDIDLKKIKFSSILYETPLVKLFLSIMLLEKGLNEDLQKQATGDIEKYEKVTRSILDIILASSPLGIPDEVFKLERNSMGQYSWKADIIGLLGETDGPLTKIRNKEEYRQWINIGRKGLDVWGKYGDEEVKTRKLKNLKHWIKNYEESNLISTLVSLGLLDFRFTTTDETLLNELKNLFPEKDFSENPTIRFIELVEKIDQNKLKEDYFPLKNYFYQHLLNKGLGLQIHSTLNSGMKYSLADSTGVVNKGIAKNILYSVAAECGYIGHGTVIYKNKDTGEIIKQASEKDIYRASYYDSSVSKDTKEFLSGEAILAYDTNAERYLFIRGSEKRIYAFWFRETNPVSHTGEIVYDDLYHYCKDANGSLKKGIYIIGTEDVYEETIDLFHPKRNIIRSNQPLIIIEKSNAEDQKFTVSIKEYGLSLFRFVNGKYQNPTSININFASFLYPRIENKKPCFALQDEDLNIIDSEGIWPLFMGLFPGRYTYNVLKNDIISASSSEELLKKLNEKENLPLVEIRNQKKQNIVRLASVNEVNQKIIENMIRWYTTKMVYSYYLTYDGLNKKMVLGKNYIKDWNAVEQLTKIIEIIQDYEGVLFQQFGFNNKEEYRNFRNNMIEIIKNDQRQYYQYKKFSENIETEEEKLIAFLEEQKNFFNNLNQNAAKLESFQDAAFMTNFRTDFFEINDETQIDKQLNIVKKYSLNRYHSYNTIYLFKKENNGELIPSDYFARNPLSFSFDKCLIQMGTYDFINVIRDPKNKVNKIFRFNSNQNLIDNSISDLTNSIFDKKMQTQNPIQIIDGLTPSQFAMQRHLEIMRKLRSAKSYEQIMRVKYRFWEIFNKVTKNNPKITFNQLMKIVQQFNEQKGENIISKNGMGAVLKKMNSKYYFISLYSVNAAYDVIPNRVVKDSSFSSVQTTVGLFKPFTFKENKDKPDTVITNCAMVNIINLINQIGDLSNNFEDSSNIIKISNNAFKKGIEAITFYNIIKNYLGKERADDIIKLILKSNLIIGRLATTNDRYYKMSANGKKNSVRSNNEYAEAMFLGDIYLLLEIIYGLYYSLTKTIYRKLTSVNLTETVVKFKVHHIGEDTYFSYDSIFTKRMKYTGSFSNYINNEISNQDAKEVIQFLEKTPFKSVFSDEFISQDKLKEFIDNTIEELKTINEGLIENSISSTKNDYEIELVAKKFSIFELIKSINSEIKGDNSVLFEEQRRRKKKATLDDFI